MAFLSSPGAWCDVAVVAAAQLDQQVGSTGYGTSGRFRQFG
jgi:hypothetical protein